MPATEAHPACTKPKVGMWPSVWRLNRHTCKNLTNTMIAKVLVEKAYVRTFTYQFCSNLLWWEVLLHSTFWCFVTWPWFKATKMCESKNLCISYRTKFSINLCGTGMLLRLDNLMNLILTLPRLNDIQEREPNLNGFYILEQMKQNRIKH